VIDEVFLASEVVEPYRVAPSIDLDENLNFRVFDDSVVDVDTEELNAVLSSSEECDEDDNNSIEDEDEKSDKICCKALFL
jgi:hypothetical protein